MDIRTGFYIVFATIFIGPVVGDFKSSSMAKPPVFDIGDGVSLGVKAYPCQYSWLWMWQYQLLTINSDVTGEQKELGWAQIKCADFDKIKRELSPGYISLGDAVFVTAVKDKPVTVIFKMKNKSCQQKVLTDGSWNPLEKVENKPLNKKECAAEIKNIRPRKVHLGSTTMMVRLDPKTFTKAFQTNVMHIPNHLTGQQQLSVKKSTTGEIVATGSATGAVGSVVIANKEQAKQPVQRLGKSNKQPLMSMLSLDTSDIDEYIAKWEEGVGWYLSDQLVMTLQNLYRGLTCIRVVTIAKATPDENEDDIELAKFKTTCGSVKGLTVYPDLIKYQKGFVFVLENENEASGYFNMAPNNCLLRKYTIEGKEVKWTDENQDDEQCKELMSDTTGSIFTKTYKDTGSGYTAEGVDFVYVSNNSSPKEEEEKRKKEEKEAETEGNTNSGGWFFSKWFGKS